MTAFDNIKTNNWPATSNDLEDFLVLELPLNDQAALTSSRRDIVAGSKVLFPKRTLTNASGVSMQTARIQPDYAATGFTKSTNWRETSYEAPEIGLFNGDGTSTISAINGNNAEHWFAFPTALTNVTKVETRMGYDGQQGARAYMGTGTTNYISPSGSGTYFTVYNGAATTFSKMGWRSNNGSGAAVYDIRITDDTGTYVLTSNENLKKHYDNNATFDGTSSRLVTPGDFAFGTGDFTVECWAYPEAAATSEDGLFQISTDSNGYYAGQANTVTLQSNSGAWRVYANDTSNAMSTSVVNGQWVHLALVRNNGTLRLYVNGVQDSTTISDSRNYTCTHIAIGTYYSLSYVWDGKIQDFRVYKGVAKYTSNFTPPAAILG